MGDKAHLQNKEKNVNAWLVDPYQYMAQKNKDGFRSEVMKVSEELELGITPHIFYNWTYRVTKIKGYIANIVKPILEKWVAIDDEERAQIKAQIKSAS